jgi:putative ABC transport system ATP-binding protein
VNDGGPPPLRADHLGRVVGATTLVDDVSFSMNRAEVLAIVGPSGAGKSTLLRMLNRLDEPTSGTVWIDGRDYREMPPRELRHRVGMVMQQPSLFPGSVERNLRFGPQQRGETMTATEVDALLSAVGLPGCADRDVAVLSCGEAQRVCIARALANRPDVLLMDEPTSALDEESKVGVEGLLRSLIAKHGLTCVVVTHDPAQALRLAQRALVLESGTMVAIGPVTEVIDA